MNTAFLTVNLTMTLKSGVAQTHMWMQMAARLGVSQAVLSNVIFCHQEEMNWSVFLSV